MYGITGTRTKAKGSEETLMDRADTWVEAHDRAEAARKLGWRQLRVIPAVADTCHSPLGYTPNTPVCGLCRGHTGEWHETRDGVLTWRDDYAPALRTALEDQRERDGRCLTDA